MNIKWVLLDKKLHNFLMLQCVLLHKNIYQPIILKLHTKISNYENSTLSHTNLSLIMSMFSTESTLYFYIIAE